MTLLANAQAAPRLVLGSVSRTIGLSSRRPWLPAGETLRGRLFLPGDSDGPALGLPLLDRPGALDVRVRLGYAPGLTGAGPTVSSLAVRLDVDGTAVDLAFDAPPAPRGAGRGRRRNDHCVLLTSRTTYAAAGGPLQLAARVCGSETFELLCGEGEDWRSIGDLRVSPSPLGEPPLLVDPVARPLPGAGVLDAGHGRAV